MYIGRRVFGMLSSDMVWMWRGSGEAHRECVPNWFDEGGAVRDGKCDLTIYGKTERAVPVLVILVTNPYRSKNHH